MISRDKSLLCPAFRDRLEEMERLLAIDHLPYALYEGFRTFEQSDDYYAQGRTKPGKIITNARGGDSLHNYSIAADYVKLIGGQWSWDGSFKSLGELAEQCGLEWGGNWKRFPDYPHVQMPGLTLNEIKELYRQSNGDLKAIWQHYT